MQTETAAKLVPVTNPPQYKNESYPDANDENTDVFWGSNPNVLFQAVEFYPVETMTYNQKLNAVSRLVLILTILSFLFTSNTRILLIGAVTMGAVFLLHRYDGTTLHQRKREAFENPALEVLKKHPVQLGPETFDAPTVKNPFSNVMPADYDYNPLKKPAPPIFEQSTAETVLEQAKQTVRNSNPGQPDIADKLFKDLGDAFVFEQSLRPFNSNPATTIPNDQAGFADFCYGSMVSCKEGNQFACARNLDRHTF